MTLPSDRRPRPEPDGLPPAPATLRIRSEVDVLALVPYSLGFHPEDSAVLLAVDAGGRPFVARADLPDEPAHLVGLGEALVVPARRNGGGVAFVVVYSADHGLADAAAQALGSALADAGIDLVMTIRAHDSCWHRLTGEPAATGEGVRYDLSTHELTTRSVLEGRVTRRSRDELAASLAPAARATVEEVAAAHRELGPLPDGRRALRAEARWAVAQVRALRRRTSDPGPRAAARLLRAAAHPEVRDALWAPLTRANAASHARAWLGVVRRSPPHLVAPAAAMLALCAWVDGDGALARCAVDHSLATGSPATGTLALQPGHSLALLVRDMLDAAIPPSVWPPDERRSG